MEWLPVSIIGLGVLVLSLSFLPARMVLAQAAVAVEPPEALKPEPRLNPRQVITAQLVGLQNAGDPDADPDIAMRVVWNFAAPANRQVTGPFERFDAMVRAEPYGVLVGHFMHEITRLDEHPDRPVAQALVAVTDDDGEVYWFVWVLSKSEDGEAADCWVTDAVYPVEVDDEPTDPGQIV